MSDGIWVTAAGFMPCGARRLTAESYAPLGQPRRGVAWLDVCIMGQHLPQMYAERDIHGLSAEGCESLGLCPDCLGFGDTGGEPGRGIIQQVLRLARSIDEVATLCPGCGGTGRPALRVSVHRSGPETSASIVVMPHAYVPPGDHIDAERAMVFEVSTDSCLACGMRMGDKTPRGEAIHP